MYVGAAKVKVPHAPLHSGNPCPACQQGKVYPLAEPALLLRVRAMAPHGAHDVGGADAVPMKVS